MYILNNEGRALYKKQEEELSVQEKEIAQALKEKGIYITHISKLFPPGIFEELKAFVEKRWNDADIEEWKSKRDTMIVGDKMKSKEYFLVNLWGGPEEIDLKHPFIRFSLYDSMLRVVAGYMGVYPKFRYWSLQATMPMSEGMRAYASQQWHRDPDDQKLVKVFLYLNDIDETAGPFTYLKYSQQGGKWRNIFPQHPPRGTEKMPRDADARIPKEDVAVCTGKAGTLVFADTSGLHKGGYASSSVRFMYTSAYLSNASPWPIRYTYPPQFNSDGLSKRARYVLANDVHQQEPRFY